MKLYLLHGWQITLFIKKNFDKYLYTGTQRFYSGTGSKYDCKYDSYRFDVKSVRIMSLKQTECVEQRCASLSASLPMITVITVHIFI